MRAATGCGPVHVTGCLCLLLLALPVVSLQITCQWECARAASGISDTTAPVVGREARPRPKPHPVIHTGVSWLASLAG